MKLSTDQNQNKNKVQSKKTRFHNFEQRTDSYSADDLEAVAEKKRQEYKGKLKKQNEAL